MNNTYDWWCEPVCQTAAPVWLPQRWTARHLSVIQTPNDEGILVHVLPVCSSVEWTEKGSKWNSWLLVNTSGYLSMKAGTLMFTSDSVSWSRGNPPPTHLLTQTPPTNQRCQTLLCGICRLFDMSHGLGPRRGVIPQWPAARHHLSRSTPIQPLDNYVLCCSPAALCGEIFQPWCS